MAFNPPCKIEIPNTSTQENHLQLEKGERKYEDISVVEETLCMMNLSLKISCLASEEIDEMNIDL